MVVWDEAADLGDRDGRRNLAEGKAEAKKLDVLEDGGMECR